MDIEVSDGAIGWDAVPAAAWAVVASGCVASLVVACLLASRARRGLPLVDRRPSPPVCWNGFDVATAVVAFLGFQSIALAVLPADASLRLRLAAGTVAMAAFSGAAVLGLAVGRGGWPAVGCPFDRLAADVKLAVGGLLLILAPLLALAAALDRIVPYRHVLVDFLKVQRDPVSIGVVALAAVVAAPVAEEFLFRRLLQGWLAVRLEPIGTRYAGGVAVLVSSLAFAGAHVGQGLAWVPLFFFGLVVGTLARLTGSILPGILLHALFNAVSVVLVVLQTGGRP